jgi:phosphatidylserine decarboxylase
LFISRYGYGVVGTVFLLVALGSVLVWLAVEPKTLKYVLLGVLALVLLFTLNFFRDPDRVSPVGDTLVLAPADGKIVLIQEVREEEFLLGDATQVSIFMSPLNVHVNRFPIDGTVRHYRYHEGEYLVAFNDKSSVRNERTHIGVEGRAGRVLFKQIAGFFARRIVAEVREGDTVRAGERFGMIRFGSRVDVILPRTARIRVRTGDVTVAGQTILAELS